MVNMIIDGKHISAEENITIMEAAERNGIPIPKLCYLKGSTRSRPAESASWSWKEKRS